jgi:murein L,D-transpeptidase YcbB/YkuD
VSLVARDSAVDAYYAARNQAPIWFRDAASRDAAAMLPAILRRATYDGLAEGPDLAGGVEAALLNGQAADDRIISAAWVRYVQALQSPVDGIHYGDSALRPSDRSAEAILADAARAPSLAAHVRQVSDVNPLYASLRETAEKSGEPVDARLRSTLDRLRLLPARGRFVLVDAATARLMMIEDGRVADTMKVIVGKPSAATPLLASTIHYVTFNPYWHIPQDVARRKVAPVVVKRGVGYLKAARYETVAAFGGDKEQPIDPASIDWKAVAAGSTEVHIRQLTGPNNMMGKVKVGFANDYGVFLHDTPHKELFAKSNRNLSLGCIRLEHPDRLVAWLMGDAAIPPADGPEQLVRIKEGVPVYVSYLTAYSDEGAIKFAQDAYGLDTPTPVKAVVARSAE